MGLITAASLVTMGVRADEVGAAPCYPLVSTPTGVTDVPTDTLFPLEHHMMNSSVHLQGNPAAEKVAPVIHRPGPTSSLAGMRSIVIVNNPSPTTQLEVAIEYYDSTGSLVSTSLPSAIPPEGHYDEEAVALAGEPWGTVRVKKLSDADPDFVGATYFHTYEIGLPVTDTSSSGGGSDERDPIPAAGGESGEYEFYIETHDTRIGAASMQQLQAAQSSATELYWGPLPMSNSAAPGSSTLSPLSWDFLNGNSPLLMVTNPNAFPITANVLILDSQLNTLQFYPVSLQPFQSWVDMDFFESVLGLHEQSQPSGLVYDLDVLVAVFSDSPLVGQGVMFDFYGEDMDFLQRFRMGSTMMSNTPATTLISPEFISEDTDLATNTLIGIANASIREIGPVVIEYRDRSGAIVGKNLIPQFGILDTHRIGPGSAGYPPNEFAGSVSIHSCQPGLIGWSMKTTEHPGPPGSASASQWGGLQGWELRKAWGEVLDGANGVEPGMGFLASRPNLMRKVGPFNRVVNHPSHTGGGRIAGYNHVFNNAVSNTNPYFIRTFDSAGNELSQTGQNFPFLGIRLGATAFTYIDGPPVPLIVSGTIKQFVSTRFDHTSTAGTTGINALGGYPWEWNWYIPPPPGGPYSGPGDIIPSGP